MEKTIFNFANAHDDLQETIQDFDNHRFLPYEYYIDKFRFKVLEKKLKSKELQQAKTSINSISKEISLNAKFKNPSQIALWAKEVVDVCYDLRIHKTIRRLKSLDEVPLGYEDIPSYTKELNSKETIMQHATSKQMKSLTPALKHIDHDYVKTSSQLLENLYFLYFLLFDRHIPNTPADSLFETIILLPSSIKPRRAELEAKFPLYEKLLQELAIALINKVILEYYHQIVEGHVLYKNAFVYFSKEMLEPYVGPVEQYLPSTVTLPPHPLTPPQPTLEELQQTYDLPAPAPVIEPEPVIEPKKTDSPPQTKAAIKKGLPKKKLVSKSLPVVNKCNPNEIAQKIMKNILLYNSHDNKKEEESEKYETKIYKIIEYLEENCPEHIVDILDSNGGSGRFGGMTPLLMAIKYNNEGFVEDFLTMGANINIRDYNDNTPLHYAYENTEIYEKYIKENEGIIPLLLKHGNKPDQNARNNRNLKPNEMAKRYEKKSIKKSASSIGSNMSSISASSVKDRKKEIKQSRKKGGKKHNKTKKKH